MCKVLLILRQLIIPLSKTVQLGMAAKLANNVHTTKGLYCSKSLKHECSSCGTTPYICCIEPSFDHHPVACIRSILAGVPVCNASSVAWYVLMGRSARPSSRPLLTGVLAYTAGQIRRGLDLVLHIGQ